MSTTGHMLAEEVGLLTDEDLVRAALDGRISKNDLWEALHRRYFEDLAEYARFMVKSEAEDVVVRVLASFVERIVEQEPGAEMSERSDEQVQSEKAI